MSQEVYSQMMVEVFKTDVTDKEKAKLLIVEIQKEFVNCRASFDLEDCDRVLVIRSLGESIEPTRIINVLKRLGIAAEVLPDL
jgi:hypothetical protein